ncbi:MAG: response regulator transcription factor [Candidatus Sulfotelmatobacter sp.]
MTERITVLCVDDHPLMRDGIAFALQQELDIVLVAQAENGTDAVRAFRKYKPDVTLMDLQMPEMDGIAAMSAILIEFPKARIVVLTTYSGDIQATRALKLGAMGYLLKGMLRTDLIKTIRDVHAGRRHIPEKVAQEIATHVTVDELSEREIQVLRLVAGGNSNKIIADHLGITEDTVKSHMRNVLLKLQANDRTHAVTIALKRGYLNG